MTTTEQNEAAKVISIVQFGDPVLRQVADEISKEDFQSEEIQKLIDDMEVSLHAAGGIGLAAPQVGVSRRLIIIKIPAATNRPGYGEVPETPLLVVINPAITFSSPKTRRAAEGCLSIKAPGGGSYEGVVERPDRVIVQGFDREGNEITIDADKLLSRALQHEVDHLNGVLFTDLIRNVRDLRIVHPVNSDDPVFENNPFLR